jgi:hypothetical protein
MPSFPAGGSGDSGSTTRLVIIAFVIIAAVMLLGMRSTGESVAEHALVDAQRQLALLRAENARLKGKAGDNGGDEAGSEETEKPTKKPGKQSASTKAGAKAAGKNKLPTVPPKKKGRATTAAPPAEEGGDARVDTPKDVNNDNNDGAAEEHKDSPEANKMPEDIHHPEEKTFKHWIGDLTEPPEGSTDEAKTLYKAFTAYSNDRTAVTNIPVYGTACIGEADCVYVRDQLKSLDTGVGHVIIVLNKDYKEYHDFFRELEKQFPGRFTLQYRPDGGGCSESWNIMLRLGFSITPQPNFVMATNGDLWALPGYLAKFARWMNDNLEKQVGSRFVHFSSFALNKKGWKVLGPFDEVIYPAYAEDVEYHIRAVSAGVMVGSFPGMQDGVSHKHAGSRSFTDKAFNEKYQRWDKNDYMFRKWNVDMRHYTDFQHCHPYKHPWNQPALTHRKSWVVDPGHRNCIKTGNGIHHNAHGGGCMLSSCRSCWYNASVLLPLLPPGTTLPDSITTQNRVRY